MKILSKYTAPIIVAATSLCLPESTVLADEVTPSALWVEHCTKCHGEDGKGATKMGRKLRVSDYTDPAVQAKLVDEEMIETIANGRRDENGKQAMKPYKDKLSEKDMKDLVAFIRSMAAAP